MPNALSPPVTFLLFSYLFRGGGYFLLFMFNVHPYYDAFFVPYTLVVICLERTGLLVLLCVVFSCVFVTFSYGVPGNGVKSV